MTEVFSSKDGILSKLFFNPQNLVVLGEPLRSAWSTSLDLTSIQSNNQISNESVFCLTASMAHHNTPSILLGKLTSLDRLHDRSDLVHFQQKTVACLFVNSCLDSLRVCDCKIITNNLDVNFRLQFGPGFPIILVEGILNGYNRVFLDKWLINIA